MRHALVLVSALILCACTTKPPPAPDLPKTKPIEAMQACAIQLCTLRPEIVNLDPKDQYAMILACKIADAHAFAKCAEKQRSLAEWVRKR